MRRFQSGARIAVSAGIERLRTVDVRCARILATSAARLLMSAGTERRHIPVPSFLCNVPLFVKIVSDVFDTIFPSCPSLLHTPRFLPTRFTMKAFAGGAVCIGQRGKLDRKFQSFRGMRRRSQTCKTAGMDFGPADVTKTLHLGGTSHSCFR